MGLLDDAIREHLDLKRRRGADPTEVEREEREVLGPVRPRTAGAELDERELAPSIDDEHEPFDHDEDIAWANGDSEHDDRAVEPRPPPAAFDQEQPAEPMQHTDYGREPEPYADYGREPEPYADYGREPEPYAQSPNDPEPHGVAGLDREPEPSPAAEREPYRAAEPEPYRAEPEPYRGAEFEPDPYAAQGHETEPYRAVGPEPGADYDTRRGPPDDGPSTAEYNVEAEHPEGEEEDVLEETPDFLQDTPDHDRLWFEQRPPRDFDFDG